MRAPVCAEFAWKLFNLGKSLLYLDELGLHRGLLSVSSPDKGSWKRPTCCLEVFGKNLRQHRYLSHC